MLSEEKQTLERLALEAGGIFDSVADHGASADTFFFDHNSLRTLLTLTSLGTLSGYLCRVGDAGPWTYVDLDAYQRLKDRPNHRFKELYTRDVLASEVLGLWSRLTKVMQSTSIKVEIVRGEFMVSLFPDTRKFGNLWFYKVDKSFLKALSDVLNRAQVFGIS